MIVIQETNVSSKLDSQKTCPFIINSKAILGKNICLFPMETTTMGISRILYVSGGTVESNMCDHPDSIHKDLIEKIPQRIPSQR